jgi:hypothetical protein
VPAAIPGVIQAAYFDNGASGAAYYDSSAGNQGGALRVTNVDIQRASGGGYNIGWTTPGEWVAYTVNVTRAGTYTVTLRVAATSSKTVDVSFAGATTVQRSVPVSNTGGWQSWRDVSTSMTLKAGVHVLRIQFPAGGVNLRQIELR